MDILNSLSSSFGYIGPFIILIGVLVFVHESGHFLVAKYFNVRVEVFSLGFGKKIFQWTKNETTYCISLIPLGGYVKMYGDDPNMVIPEEDQKHAFLKKPVGQRIAVVLAGPLMNLILAFFVFMAIGIIGETLPKAQIGDLQTNSEAYLAGFRSEDVITRINDKTINNWMTVDETIKTSINKNLIFTVQRGQNDEPIKITTQPKAITDQRLLTNGDTIGEIKGLSVISQAAVIGISDPQSLAGQAGLKTFDEILEVNNQKISTLRQLEQTLSSLAPSTAQIKVRAFDYKAEQQSAEIRTLQLKLTSPITSISQIGLENPQTFILSLNEDMPAFKKGLQVGDKLVSINNTPISSFKGVLDIVKNYKESDQFLTVTVLRNGKALTQQITPLKYRPKQEATERYLIGLLSATITAKMPTVLIKYNTPMKALNFASSKTILWTKNVALSLVKLIQNKISPKNLSGILTIGVVAKKSLNVGITAFLKVMAIFSINLFILNLLPIPILDGGHLLFFTLEALKGSPVSVEKLQFAQTIGFFIIMGLMLFAFFNDISNIFFTSW